MTQATISQIYAKMPLMLASQNSILLKSSRTAASQTSLLTALHITKVNKIALARDEGSQPLFFLAIICSIVTNSLATDL
jgi:hypothetical protein